MPVRCEQGVRGVCGGFGAQVREFNGEGDLVHLLVRYPPKIALSELCAGPAGDAGQRRTHLQTVHGASWGHCHTGGCLRDAREPLEDWPGSGCCPPGR
ncbi:transposase [Streptomyces phaeochromogenes]|uniref:transposase n=1 Tax=Streptomyces phaeochromogenes TaxID=1923 RepID=UPI0027D9166F|nr:transposase [Streptomyces phaeochromogenes]